MRNQNEISPEDIDEYMKTVDGAERKCVAVSAIMEHFDLLGTHGEYRATLLWHAWYMRTKLSLMPELPNPHRHQRGIALLWAMLTLWIITAITGAMTLMMVYEIKKAHKFTDGRQGHYADNAGLQEVRARMAAGSTDTIATDLPTTAATEDDGVLYVVNPASGETIQPWIAGNKFVDREICREIACSGPFPHGAHYKTIAASPAFRQTNVPLLPWKWVRIMRRIDSATFPVDRTGNQVCWDGKHESTTQAGCNPVYELTAFSWTISGSREMIHMDVAMHTFSVPAAVSLLNGTAMLQASDIPTHLSQPSPNLMLQGNDNNACCAGFVSTEVSAISTEDLIALDAVNKAMVPNDNFVGGFSMDTTLGQEQSPNGYPLNTVAGIEDLKQSVQSLPVTQNVSDCSTANFGDNTHPVVVVANNCTIGNTNSVGYGILWVTSTLSMQVNVPGASWHGIVVVSGDGICEQTVGFQTQITGALICAPTSPASGAIPADLANGYLGSLGRPTFNWKSAVPGLNEVGVQYDTCQIAMASRLLMGSVSYQEIGRSNIRREWI